MCRFILPFGLDVFDKGREMMCDLAKPTYMDDLAMPVETDMATSLLPAIQTDAAIMEQVAASQLHRWQN